MIETLKTQGREGSSGNYGGYILGAIGLAIALATLYYTKTDERAVEQTKVVIQVKVVEKPSKVETAIDTLE